MGTTILVFVLLSFNDHDRVVKKKKKKKKKKNARVILFIL